MSEKQIPLDKLCAGPRLWGVVLPPGKSVKIDFPDYAYLVITSACLPNINDETKTSRVKAVLSNIPVLDCSTADEEEKPTGMISQSPENTETETLICTLIPKVREYQKLEIVLSPLNYGHFINTGNAEVHLSGTLSPITSFDEEEEEEEAMDPPENENEK